MPQKTSGKLRIAIFQYDLGVGGVQRSLVNLLNKMDRKKYSIDLFIADDKAFFDKKIPDYVNIIRIHKLPYLTKLLPFGLVRAIYSSRFSNSASYDVAIDFNSYQNITAIGALTVAANKRLLWVHGNNAKRMVIDKAYRLAYLLQKAKINQFDGLVVVSQGLLKSTHELTGFPISKIGVVNNFIDIDEIIQNSKKPLDIIIDNSKLNLISVGRLAHEKGIDIMLKVIKEAIVKRPKLCLYIIGDGPERRKIESLIHKHKLSNNVILLGAKPNPYPYMLRMDGFISTSRHEGQGISILEAKALGLRIFIPKHLEKYTYKVKGSENLVNEIVSANKLHDKDCDKLSSYNKQVLTDLDLVLTHNSHEN